MLASYQHRRCTDEVFECETLHLLKLNNDLQLQVRQNKRTLEGNSASEKKTLSIMAEEEIKVLAIGVYEVCLAK